MSKKQETIINGTNVSECEHHYTNTVNGIIYNGCAIYEQINELGYSQDTLCEQNPDCYFKQFKRLQKENEGLKSLNDFNIQKIEVLKEEKDGMQIVINNYIEHTTKYRQALEEIRKKITPVCAYCNNIDGFTTWDDCENVCEKGVIKYLKIINEALNEQK